MKDSQYDILLVDDDEDDRQFIQMAFEQIGCNERLTVYSSGNELLSDLCRLQGQSRLPQLIVLDYIMPGAAGSEVLFALKKDDVFRTVPVILYSTGMSRNQVQECLSQGAVECFVKGTTFNAVVNFCGQLCEFAPGTSTFI